MTLEPVRLKIYRVENEALEGLYRASDYANSDLHETNGRHPMPYMDAGLSDYWDHADAEAHNFGFSSLEQLKFWIHTREARETLDREGLVVSVFYAEGWAGDTQAVFLKRTREANIETLRLTEI